MKHVLIGFEISIGVFIDDKGKDVSYSNRVITFITNAGEDNKRKGFAPYSEKFKLEELAYILNVQPSDTLVNEALMSMVNKSVIVDFAPVGGVLKVKNFRLEQK